MQSSKKIQLLALYLMPFKLKKRGTPAHCLTCNGDIYSQVIKNKTFRH